MFENKHFMILSFASVGNKRLMPAPRVSVGNKEFKDRHFAQMNSSDECVPNPAAIAHFVEAQICVFRI
jgi:hypothetical protein